MKICVPIQTHLFFFITQQALSLDRHDDNHLVVYGGRQHRCKLLVYFECDRNESVAQTETYTLEDSNEYLTRARICSFIAFHLYCESVLRNA